MTKVEFDLETTTPPETLMDALLDFSDRRPDVWPDLARKFYEVYEVGETSADVKEGSGLPFNIWAREHYEWNRGSKSVKWAAVESNFCTPGSGVTLDIKPTESGGSRVHILWQREPTTAKGRFLIKMVARNNGKMLRGFLQKSLDSLPQRIAATSR